MSDVGSVQRMPPNAGKGRTPGSVSKTTELVRASLRSALEILRGGNGENPVEASQKIARFLEGMSQKRMEQLAEQPLSGDEFDRIVNTLYKAANIQLRLADYVYPKPGRIDLPERSPDARTPKTLEELAAQLEERGLPGWVLGDDMPILDLTPEEEVRVNGNGNGNGNGEIPE